MSDPQPIFGPMLFIFATAQSARNAGFRMDRRHYKSDMMVAWWPGLDEDILRGIEWEFVYVDSETVRPMYAREEWSALNKFNRLVERLKASTRTGHAIVMTP